MRKFLLFVLVALALACASRANAGSLGFTGTGKDVSGIGIRGSEGTHSNVFAGELNWDWLATTGPGFRTTIYWIDILNDVLNTGTMSAESTDSLTSPGIAPDGDARAAWLFNTYAADVHAPGTNALAAGLQVAIWKALYDQTANLKKGNATFRHATGPDRKAANAYLHALFDAPRRHHTSTAGWPDTKPDRERRGRQDPVTPVPEPGSLVLAAIGMIVLLAGARKCGFVH